MAQPVLAESRELGRAWRAVLGRLQLEVGKHTFETWLRDTRAVRLQDGVLVVEVPNSFKCDWLNERLAFVVSRAASAVLSEEVSVCFVPSRVGSEGARARAQGRLTGALNCSLTFERYVPSEGNRLALACCRSILDEDGPISPLVLWGPPGLGKTHLLHALGCAAIDRGWPVAAFTADDFTTRFVSALRRNEAEAFQAEIRAVRLFLLDDLQELEGKRATLEELVHTIDAVERGGGYVVVASERHPQELKLPDRLQSRLLAGVVARVEPLSQAARRALILQIATELRASLPSWCVDRLAAAGALSVREVYGAVRAAVALDRAGLLEPGRLDAELARLVVTATARKAAPEVLLERVAAEFGLALEELLGRSRRGPCTEARAVASALLRRQGMNLAAIGRALGGRDPATVKEAANRGERLLAERPDLADRLAS